MDLAAPIVKKHIRQTSDTQRVNDHCTAVGRTCLALKGLCGALVVSKYHDPTGVEPMVKLLPEDSSHCASLKLVLYLLHLQPMATNSASWIAAKKILLDYFNFPTQGFSQSLAIHLFTNEIAMFHDTISKLVGMQVQFRSEKYVMLRQMTAELFTLATLPHLTMFLFQKYQITKLAISLFHHLLKMHLFNNTNVDVHLALSSIMSRLASEDVDSTVLEVISVFQESVREGKISGIPWDLVIKTIQAETRDTPKALFTYYYTQEVAFARIPDIDVQAVKASLRYTREKMKILHPDLSRIAYISCPAIYDLEANLLRFRFAEWNKRISPTSNALLRLHTQDSVDTLLQHVPSVLRYRTDLLTEPCSFRQSGENDLAQFKGQWLHFFSENPAETCRKTIEWFQSYESSSRIPSNDFQCVDPVQLLRSLGSLCKKHLIAIYLKIALFYSREFCHEVNVRIRNQKSQDGENMSLLYQSRLAQHLLFLLEHDQEQPVQRALCDALHQIFVDDITCLRLVHFQGYNAKIVPLVVASIPSIHVCIDLIPELLKTTHFGFGFCLAVSLCKVYPLVKTKLLADQLLHKIQGAMKELPSGVAKLSEVLPFLPQFALLFHGEYVQAVSAILIELQNYLRPADKTFVSGDVLSRCTSALSEIHQELIHSV
ncbi:Integrator complex subunit 2 [Kappamyces sp. JEL0829]|nr:Integrator complex subunit 2 [Kappamyces sp. JEL0829]